jgi:hypothetical protein
MPPLPSAADLGDGDAARAVLTDLDVATDIVDGDLSGAVLVDLELTRDLVNVQLPGPISDPKVTLDTGNVHLTGAVGDLHAATRVADVDLPRAVFELERADIRESRRAAAVFDFERQGGRNRDNQIEVGMCVPPARAIRDIGHHHQCVAFAVGLDLDLL